LPPLRCAPGQQIAPVRGSHTLRLTIVGATVSVRT
jgi:hypothetical protein